jgi:hypothetical protein
MRGMIGNRGSKGKATRGTALLVWIALLVVASGSGSAGAAAASGLRAPASANAVTVGAKAVVTNTDGDPIRVREGAGTAYARIAWAREGDIVSVLAGPVTGDGIQWFKVQASSVGGWMMAQFLRGTEANRTPAAPATARLNGTVRVANTDGDRLRVRSTPVASGIVIGYLDPGATGAVEDGPVIDSSGIVWYRISANGLRGWSMAIYLLQADSPRAVAAPVSAPAQAEPAASSGTGTRVGAEQLRQWIEEARAQYPYAESTDKMWRVMTCESSGNPNASAGGRYLGLFQYLQSTWAGSWNPYRNNSIWDAKSQIFATARAWSMGMQNHWSCY